MATKIDNEKLDQYIGELNSLHTEWVNYKRILWIRVIMVVEQLHRWWNSRNLFRIYKMHL